MKKTTFLWILGIILASFVILLPLIRNGFYLSDDGEWMIIRLTAFFQSLKDGQIPTRFLGRLNYGYGYPVSNFLYPGFLYIGSVFHVFGLSFINSIKLILGASIIGSSVFIFLALRKYFDELASFIGSLSFIFMPYVAYDLYRRGSVGEILAFFPAALSYYSLVSNKRWLFPVSVGFLILSHNSLALLFLLFFLFFILVNRKWNFFLPLALGVGSASFFWIPALYDRKYVIFDSVQIADPVRYFIQGNEMPILGLSGLLAFVIAVFSKRKPQKIRQYAPYLLVFLLSIGLATPISTYIWQHSVLASLIQFPYRFLALSGFVSCWATAYAWSIIQKPYRIVFLICIIGLSLSALLPIVSTIHYVDHPNEYYSTNEATTTVADEYLPRWIMVKPTTHADKKVIFYQGAGELKTTGISSKRIFIETVSKQSAIVQINTMYYPGWGAAIDDQPVIINYHNPEGVIRIDVPPGSHKIMVEFRETISRFFADIATLISIFLYFFYIVTMYHSAFTRVRSVKIFR